MKVQVFRHALLRHLLSFLIVGGLCFYYYQKTNRWQIWLFLPISVIPLVITLLLSKRQEENFEVDYSEIEKLRKKES